MLVLITNDDGFGADGLEVMKRIASSITSDVWVVVPSDDVSGCSRSIACSWPVAIEQQSTREFKVKGPTSVCVALAVQSGVLPRKPDLVLSGVNSGSNVGSDIMYSGTVGGILEATSLEISSIAFSQYYKNKLGPMNWQAAEEYGPSILRQIIDELDSNGFAVNVNFPHIDDVIGVKVVNQGFHYDSIRVDNVASPEGAGSECLYAIRHSRVFDGTGSVAALKDGFITITPLQTDLTCWKTIQDLNKLNNMGS